MTWAASSARAASVAAVALALAEGAAADSYLQVQLDGPMTPDMRVALSNLLDPQTDYQLLIDAFQQAVSATSLVEDGTLPADRFTPEATLRAPAPIDLDRTVTANALDVDPGAPGVESFQFSGFTNGPISADNRADPSFIITDPDSDFFRAFGGFSRLPAATGGGGIAGSQGVAVPISRQQISQLDRFGLTDARPGITSLVLLDTAVNSLALLDRDVETLNSSFRSIRIPGAGPTDEQLAALEAAFSAAGLPLPTVVTEPDDVRIDSTPGEIEQTGADGRCSGADAGWPFDTAATAEVLQRNLEILGRLGIQHFQRSQVMVVDSGLPRALAEDPAFAPFLHVDMAASLVRGEFLPDTGLKPTCTRPGLPPRAHRYGYVVKSGHIGTCLNVTDIAQIAPPRPAAAPDGYVWDHGGFVGVLAAGGPGLMTAVEGLDRLVGVSFAKVMRDEDAELRAEPTDISEAIEFATRRQVPILNLSLRVSGTGQDEIFPKLLEYWDREDGLVVAAAGNSGGLLTPGSRVFPAMAVQSPRDNMIVVGGLEPAGAGVRIWAQSSLSPSMVDIAAPAVAIRSLDGNGRPGCYLGTSVAAPQVSFVAAVLRAMGLTRPAEIKRRILATADIEPALAGAVRDGRVLHTARALDVFADLLWRRGAAAPERVEVLGHLSANGFPFVRLCNSGADYDGWIDLTRLHAFERRPDGMATIWQEANEPSGLSGLDTRCPILDSARFVIRTATGTEEIAVGEVDRLVPSRFRAAFDLEGLPL